jgi:hypothetical protein
MIFVFDKVDSGLHLNFTHGNERKDQDGIGRFTVAPVISTIIRCITVEATTYRKFTKQIGVSFKPVDFLPYIIPTGVAHWPYDWCGPDKYKNGYDEKNPNRRNLFSFIKPEYLQDLQRGHAYLLIDQTHEGYHVPWLWEWFHNSCDQYNIPASQIIYITGNILSEHQYKAWADSHGLQSRMLTFGLAHFENVVWEISKSYNHNAPGLMPPPGLEKVRQLPTYEYHLEYKSKNPIKAFNILQKRPRGHRMWFFKYLFDNNLLDNIISMNTFEQDNTYYEGRKMTQQEYDSFINLLPIVPNENPANYKLENFASASGGQYILYLNDLTMLDSWCTIVSEASYGQGENNCFLSEKTFKPIACQHPFMILGSKGALKELRKLGYKTFHPFIDESYDDLNDWERMEAIIEEMKRIQNMTHEQRMEWYQSMEHILKFNFNLLNERGANYVEEVFTRLKEHTE